MTDAWEQHQAETGLNPGPVWRDRGVIIANLTERNQALEERVAELELAALNLRDQYQGAHEREQALRERLTEIAAADSVWDIVRDLRALAASPAVDATPEPTPAIPERVWHEWHGDATTPADEPHAEDDVRLGYLAALRRSNPSDRLASIIDEQEAAIRAESAPVADPSGDTP